MLFSQVAADAYKTSTQAINAEAKKRRKSKIIKRHYERIFLPRRFNDGFKLYRLIEFCVGRRVSEANLARSIEDIANDNDSEMSDLSE